MEKINELYKNMYIMNAFVITDNIEIMNIKIKKRQASILNLRNISK